MYPNRRGPSSFECKIELGDHFGSRASAAWEGVGGRMVIGWIG